MQDDGYGAGPPFYVSDHSVQIVALVLVLAAIIACVIAYRMGLRQARRRMEIDHSHAPGLIFTPVRQALDIALMATGERVFGPARTVLETVELYLGPVLLPSDGFGKAYGRLSRALNPIECDAPHPSKHSQAPSASLIVFAGPSFEALAPTPDEPPMIGVKEQARAVREALEAFSEHWRKEQVEMQLTRAQQALTIRRPLTPSAHAHPHPQERTPGLSLTAQVH